MRGVIGHHADHRGGRAGCEGVDARAHRLERERSVLGVDDDIVKSTPAEDRCDAGVREREDGAVDRARLGELLAEAREHRLRIRAHLAFRRLPGVAATGTMLTGRPGNRLRWRPREMSDEGTTPMRTTSIVRARSTAWWRHGRGARERRRPVGALRTPR